MFISTSIYVLIYVFISTSIYFNTYVIIISIKRDRDDREVEKKQRKEEWRRKKKRKRGDVFGLAGTLLHPRSKIKAKPHFSSIILRLFSGTCISQLLEEALFSQEQKEEIWVADGHIKSFTRVLGACQEKRQASRRQRGWLD